jgi:hypothetical protein
MGANGFRSAEELPMRMMSIRTASAAVVIMAISHVDAGAQSRTQARGQARAPQTVSGVSLGYSDIGVVLGLGGIGEADIALGGRFERVFKALPDMGNGLLGLQVGVDWYHWSAGYSYPGGAGNASATVIPIGVTANYHFKVVDKKFDPFVGAGLGYEIANASACVVYLGTQYCGGSGSYDSGIYMIVKGGLRYFMSNATALYAELGLQGATLNVGFTWRMGK